MTYTACVNYLVLFYFNSLKICNLSVIKGDTQDYPEYLINLNALKQYWTTKFSWFRNRPEFVNDFRKVEQPWVRYFWGVNIQLSLESNNSSKSVLDEKLGLRPWRHVIAVGLCTEVPRTYSTPLTASRMTGRAVRVFLLLSSSASLDWQIGFPASFLKDITQDFADFLTQHWIESGRKELSVKLRLQRRELLLKS